MLLANSGTPILPENEIWQNARTFWPQAWDWALHEKNLKQAIKSLKPPNPPAQNSVFVTFRWNTTTFEIKIWHEKIWNLPKIWKISCLWPLSFLSLHTVRPSFEYYWQVYFVHSGLYTSSLYCRPFCFDHSGPVFLFTDKNRQQPTTNLQQPTTTVNDPDQPTTSVVWLNILFIRS